MTPVIIEKLASINSAAHRNLEVAAQLVNEYMVRVLPDNMLKVIVKGTTEMNKLARIHNMEIAAHTLLEPSDICVTYSCKAPEPYELLKLHMNPDKACLFERAQIAGMLATNHTSIITFESYRSECMKLGVRFYSEELYRQFMIDCGRISPVNS